MSELASYLADAFKDEKRICILGVGTELCHDDAAGLLVIERLSERMNLPVGEAGRASAARQRRPRTGEFLRADPHVCAGARRNCGCGLSRTPRRVDSDFAGGTGGGLIILHAYAAAADATKLSQARLRLPDMPCRHPARDDGARHRRFPTRAGRRGLAHRSFPARVAPDLLKSKQTLSYASICTNRGFAFSSIGDKVTKNLVDHSCVVAKRWYDRCRKELRSV